MNGLRVATQDGQQLLLTLLFTHALHRPLSVLQGDENHMMQGINISKARCPLNSLLFCILVKINPEKHSAPAVPWQCKYLTPGLRMQPQESQAQLHLDNGLIPHTDTPGHSETRVTSKALDELCLVGLYRTLAVQRKRVHSSGPTVDPFDLFLPRICRCEIHLMNTPVSEDYVHSSEMQHPFAGAF